MLKRERIKIILLLQTAALLAFAVCFARYSDVRRNAGLALATAGAVVCMLPATFLCAAVLPRVLLLPTEPTAWHLAERTAFSVSATAGFVLFSTCDLPTLLWIKIIVLVGVLVLAHCAAVFEETAYRGNKPVYRLHMLLFFLAFAALFAACNQVVVNFALYLQTLY